jgi:hypothetical protein
MLTVMTALEIIHVRPKSDMKSPVQLVHSESDSKQSDHGSNDGICVTDILVGRDHND